MKKSYIFMSLHWVINVMCDSYITYIKDSYLTYIKCGSHVATGIYNLIKCDRSLNIFLFMLKSQKKLGL